MNNISNFRKRAGLTQEQLAKACNWNGQSRISHYESGKRAPSLNDCREIVSAFNVQGVSCSLDDVFPPKSKDAAA